MQRCMETVGTAMHAAGVCVGTTIVASDNKVETQRDSASASDRIFAVTKSLARGEIWEKYGRTGSGADRSEGSWCNASGPDAAAKAQEIQKEPENATDRSVEICQASPPGWPQWGPTQNKWGLKGLSDTAEEGCGELEENQEKKELWGKAPWLTKDRSKAQKGCGGWLAKDLLGRVPVGQQAG